MHIGSAAAAISPASAWEPLVVCSQYNVQGIGWLIWQVAIIRLVHRQVVYEARSSEYLWWYVYRSKQRIGIRSEED